MKKWGRILLIVVSTLTFIAVGLGYVYPVAWSVYYAHRTAREFPYVNQVPVALKDLSISRVPGSKLSHQGFEFEVPWTDLDETQTKQIPGRVTLGFRSGLVLSVASGPPRQAQDLLRTTPNRIDLLWGREAAQSDYGFKTVLYSFTPDRLYRVSLSPSSYYRDDMLLMLKVAALGNVTNSGIFNINNDSYRGFQMGNPQVRPNFIAVDLYSDDGTVSLWFFQQKFSDRAGVSQAHINRIVQSLHKAPEGKPKPPEQSAARGRTARSR